MTIEFFCFQIAPPRILPVDRRKEERKSSRYATRILHRQLGCGLCCENAQNLITQIRASQYQVHAHHLFELSHRYILALLRVRYFTFQILVQEDLHHLH